MSALEISSTLMCMKLVAAVNCTEQIILDQKLPQLAVIVPVNYAQLVEIAVFINGNLVSNAVDLEPYTDSVVYNNNFTYQSLDIVYNDNEITVTSTNGTSNSGNLQ
jgi:hypothetical protein